MAFYLLPGQRYIVSIPGSALYSPGSLFHAASFPRQRLSLFNSLLFSVLSLSQHLSLSNSFLNVSLCPKAPQHLP